MTGFRFTTIDLPDDYEGRVIATLIEAHPRPCLTQERPAACDLSSPPRGAVLYLHGYLDYFFQEHFARRILDSGRSFYALDLRKYGRSYLPGQHFDYCRRLDEYYPEIDRALEAMRLAGHDDITLVGHSTGGLLAALYCAEGNFRERISRLILNSPFLAFNAGAWERRVMIPLAGALSRIFPYMSARNRLSDNYFLSIHRSACGEWDFDLHYKPRTIPLYFAWLGAVRSAQRKAARGLGLRLPVLVLHSARSSWHEAWDPEALSTDTVLDVADIVRLAPRLGSRVETEAFEGGLHDLTLSRPEVRRRVMRRMTEFMDRPLPGEASRPKERSCVCREIALPL
ncbi:MAG: alpha/beta fold hydrolase [Rikenellaceae bacterium]|nr:alpha/beta fold hydrolase [Rikenellaceae bacterium]